MNDMEFIYHSFLVGFDNDSVYLENPNHDIYKENEEGKKFVRIANDGTVLKHYNCEKYVTNFDIYDDWVYLRFSDTHQKLYLARMKKDSSEYQVIHDKKAA